MRHWGFLLCIFFTFYYSECESNYLEDCLKETGAAKNKSEINMNDPQLKCFDTCVYRKKGLLKNGKIDTNTQFDALKKSYAGTLSTLKDHVQHCASIANDKKDECEVVNTMKKCISEKVKV